MFSDVVDIDSCSFAAETKNFMELTMVTDVSLATRWVKGNNNNAQAAILAYFNDPTKVPPAILAPVIQRQSNAIGIESKTPSDGCHNHKW